MARRLRSRRPRRPRRRMARRSRVPRGMRAQLRPYSYVFTLEPQILQSATTGTTPVVVNTFAGQLPIVQSNLTSNASNTGFTNNWDFGLACHHNARDIANWSSYFGIYDAYKITKITAKIEYLANTAGPQGSALLPTVWAYWDQDDTAVPTNIAALTGKTGVKMFTYNATKRIFNFTFRPTIRESVETSANANSPYAISGRGNQWINCGGDGTIVNHYAFKMWCTDFYAAIGPASANAFRITWKYHVTFRSPLATT